MVALRNLAAVAMLLSMCALIAPAHANQIPQLSFAEQVQRSDTVVVGSVVRIEQDRDWAAAIFEVSTVLKGEVHGPMRIVLGGEIHEDSMGPLPVDVQLILCVRRGIDGRYYPVNGPRSAWRLQVGSHD